MQPSLLDIYDGLKGKPSVAYHPSPMTPSQIGAFHHQIGLNRAMLKEKCAKHIILDIYCKILPMSPEEAEVNQGRLGNDISRMLHTKGMTPTEYLTSSYEKTKAPMLEYVLRSLDLIGNSYIEEAEKELEDAKDGSGPSEPSEPPELDEDPVKTQIVDLKNDMEYQQFVDILKKKTVDKIVNDVSDLINTKKEEQDMTFDTSGGGDEDSSSGDEGDMLDSDISLEPDEPEEGGNEEEAPPEEGKDEGESDNPVDDLPDVEEMNKNESVVGIGLDFINRSLKGYAFTEKGRDAAIELAVREAALYQLDRAFNQTTFKEASSRLSFGRGLILNKESVQEFTEERDYYDALIYSKLASMDHDVHGVRKKTEQMADDIKDIAASVKKIADKVSG